MSTAYPGIGGTVDYEIEGGSIVRLRQVSRVQGCQR